MIGSSIRTFCLLAPLLVFGVVGCGGESGGNEALPASPDSLNEQQQRPDAAPLRQSPSAGSVADRVENAKLETRVVLALADERQLRGHEFSVEASDGTVQLSGKVPSNALKSRAVSLAEGVDGVRGVIDRIESNEPSQPSPPENSEADVQDAADDEDASSGEETHHTVQSGESLWTIARRYDTSVAELERLNDGSNRLRPGQRIRVR